MKKWAFKMKEALLIIDMLNDFVLPGVAVER
jgi:nicotinamidase-related amidase